MCCSILKFSNQFFTSDVKKWYLIALRLLFFKKWKITICHVLARADTYYNVLQTTTFYFSGRGLRFLRLHRFRKLFLSIQNTMKLISSCYRIHIPNIILFACQTTRIEHSSPNQNILSKALLVAQDDFCISMGKGGFFFLLSLHIKMHQGFLIKADQLLMTGVLPG